MAELTRQQQRDELRVQMHLGNHELKDELDRLDDTLSKLCHRAVRAAVEDTARDGRESLKRVGGEIKEVFRRIREAL